VAHLVLLCEGCAGVVTYEAREGVFYLVGLSVSFLVAGELVFEWGVKVVC